MNEQAIQAFLHQFATSKAEVDAWPPWMKESARVAVAAFPKTQEAEMRLHHPELPAEATKENKET